MPGRMNRGVPVTEADVERWIAQGYGQGEGALYKPWLTVRDVPSKGRSHRPPCLKSGRELHLLSDREMACFLHAQFSPIVVDIREQFALLPRESTEQIADVMGVRHPRYFGSRANQVMTTDFLLTLRSANHGYRYIAISVKPSDKLLPLEKNRRTQELLEIERRYWNARGIDWRQFSDQHMNPMVIKTLQKLLMWRIAYADISADGFAKPFAKIINEQHNVFTNLRALIDYAAANVGLPCLVDRFGMFAYTVWLGLIPINMAQPLAPIYPVRLKETNHGYSPL